MNAILKPVSPELCEKVISGECTLLLSKTRPKLETPFKEYIYCTKGKEVLVTNKVVSWTGEVIGEFVCDRIDEYRTEFYEDEETYQEIREVWLDEDYDYPVEDYKIITTNERENPNDCKLLKNACLTFNEVKKYVGYGDGKFCSLHISDLKIYDKPKELGENGDFKFPCVRGGEDFDSHRKCVGCKYARLWTGTKEIYCDRWVTRAPQSWCYVEELEVCGE